VLIEPRALLSHAPVVPGSDGRKMSKSLENTIDVRDDEATVRERRDALDETPELAAEVLAEGLTKVRPVVEETMKAVRSAMSFG